jgi:hypothetical protein
MYYIDKDSYNYMRHVHPHISWATNNFMGYLMALYEYYTKMCFKILKFRIA